MQATKSRLATEDKGAREGKEMLKGEMKQEEVELRTRRHDEIMRLEMRKVVLEWEILTTDMTKRGRVSSDSDSGFASSGSVGSEEP